MRWSHRLFRLLLLAYPTRFRREHGEEMWFTFERHLREARSSGRLAVGNLWRRELVAVVRAGRQARVSQHHETRAHAHQPAPLVRKQRPPRMSLLDFKLGFRMLVKYPGLTIIGGLALAFVIALGAGSLVFLTDLLYPALPFDGGNRLVTIENWDVRTRTPQRRLAYDYGSWRGELQTVEDLSAYSSTTQNLISDGSAERVLGAQMTGSGFDVVRTPALIGRTLIAADERRSAPPVVVLGYDFWQQNLGGDPDIVGTNVRLGAGEFTVVGVMPRGFQFPRYHHFWIPLQLDVTDYEPGGGPPISVFGRLAPGISREEAQTELTAFGARAAANLPATHEHLLPLVERFGSMVSSVTISGFTMYSLSTLMLLALFCLASLNVALLVFARTATRESELVIRSALGAGRGRIIMQLFAEALVLGAFAALLGLAVADAGLGWAVGTMEQVEGQLPYWFHDNITPAAAFGAALLTILGALIVGILPALKATGRHGRTHLQQMGGRTSALRMGGLWTGVIVAQVAFTVFFVRIALEVGIDTAEIRSADPGFPAEEFLSARLSMTLQPSGLSTDTSRAAHVAAFRDAYQDLSRRVAAEPDVAEVTLASQIPGAFHPRRWVEIEGVPAPEGRFAHQPQTGAVHLNSVQAFDQSILAGRGFTESDLGTDTRVVLVNESFVREILRDRNAVGRHLRYMNADDGQALPDQSPELWYEIVGVVSDIAMTIDPDLPHNGGIYHPLMPTTEPPIRIAVHVAGDPPAFEPTLRALATAADPALQIDEIRPMDEAQWDLLMAYDAWFRAVVVGGALAVLLSNAGIYSVMSFAVSRRTREIGIRVALGSDDRRIVGAIFSRSLMQVGGGIAVGTIFLILAGAVEPSAQSMSLFAAYVGGTTVICLLACIVPTRRALRIQPTEALRTE